MAGEGRTERAQGQVDDRATGRQWAGLVLLVLPMLMLSTDLTVLFLALPTLSQDLEATASQSLWIVHVYGFLVAGFLVTMGRLADRIGPRRLLFIGAATFAAFSVVAAFSVNAEMLIAARALLGVAGATLTPSLFSLLRIMFRDDTQRRVAIAIMFSAFSIGGATGPLLGGVLLEFFWWGSVFLINVPAMVLLLLAGPRLIPERAERNSAHLDWPSVALSVTGTLAVVYGLQDLAAGQETGTGAQWPYLIVIAAGISLLALFVRRQRRLKDPLFDLALLTSRRITVSLATLLLVGIGVVGAFYLFTQYLQLVVGLSPLHAGLWTLPYVVVNVAGAMLAPRAATRVRPAVVITIGLTIATAGSVLLAALTDVATPLPLLAAAIAVIGVGHGAAMALISDLIISSAPAERTGSAAAAQQVSGELGTVLGIAAGGATGVVVYRATLTATMPPSIPEASQEAAVSTVHQGISTAETFGPGGAALLDAVHYATAEGLQVYAGIAAALVALAAALFGMFLARAK
ncbi:MAG: MFS transporter [Microbacterium sp.]|uniref:MFS transporter n=1 Tax=Microbacterium sp. TaxID=51671 RepID=UPI001AC5C8BC|nr:MFS transporter [Microbacterium sp.]MBN9176968.1 MFS transporter [Microbacterium sp.]